MKRLCLLIVLLTVFGFVFAQTVSAAVLTNRYVVKGNAGAPPYDSLANAAGDIQTAIDYAYTANGSTVLVAAATYDTGGTKVAGRYLTNRVYISKAITVRSINNDPTNTIIKGAWDPVTTNGWLAIRCVYMIDGASLVGFTLTNGATIRTNEIAWDLIGLDASGGGVCVPTVNSAYISNCVIAGNTAAADHCNGYAGGGAFYGTFFNCKFTGNSMMAYAYSGGGGTHYAVLSNCTLSGNSTAGAGGGAYRGTLYGCLVSNNSSTGYGGGIAGYNDANPIIAYNCTIVSNRVSSLASSWGGGAIYAVLSNCTVNFNRTAGAASTGRGGGAHNSTLINCQVISNYNDFWGGGAYGCTMTKCTLAYNIGGAGGGAFGCTMYDCLVYGNEGNDGGGVYAIWGASLINCTVVGNYARGNVGGGIANGGAVAINVINSLVYSNTALNNYPNWVSYGGGVISFDNSCTFPTNQTGYSGGSNTTNYPLFMANGSGYGLTHVSGNYRLQPNSPCVNMGLNQSWMNTAVDFDGHSRIDRFSGRVDMGCYEHLPRGMMFKVR